MRVILWIAIALTTVVTVSGERSGWFWPGYGKMRNPRCISCSEVKEAHLCESCCKMNACLPNPCKNNGTCSPFDNGYSCNCATGYLGENCDVNPCDVYDPCVNNGKCYPSEFGVNCSCPLGFIGEYCQDSEDTTPVKEVRECNVTKCRVSGGACTTQRCYTDVSNCSGKACNPGQDCIDDTCMFSNDNCNIEIDRIYYSCESKGDQCGDGQYCIDSETKCVNDTCRSTYGCSNPTDGKCGGFDSGTCSDGACFASCVKEEDCNGLPCEGGYCAGIRCGESYCDLTAM